MPPKRKAPSADEDDEEYRKKRDRNNQAVKRSRVKSKERTKETQQRVDELRMKNTALEDRIKEKTKELHFLKDLFVTQVSAPPDKMNAVNWSQLLQNSDDEDEPSSKPTVEGGSSAGTTSKQKR